MNPEYKRTRFLARPPAGGFPARFGVVTACNPNGMIADETRNAAATEKLRQELIGAGREFFPVTGCSPDFSHQEPGFGIVCQAAGEIVQFGRTWNQEAVFWIEDGIVHLVSCGAGDRTVLGSWDALVRATPI
jgi:hypothetical protein